MNTMIRTAGIGLLAAGCLAISVPSAAGNQHCAGSGYGYRLSGAYPQRYPPVSRYAQSRLPFYGYDRGYPAYGGYGPIGYGGYAYPGSGYGPHSGYHPAYRGGYRH